MATRQYKILTAILESGFKITIGKADGQVTMKVENREDESFFSIDKNLYSVVMDMAEKMGINV